MEEDNKEADVASVSVADQAQEEPATSEGAATGQMLKANEAAATAPSTSDEQADAAASGQKANEGLAIEPSSGKEPVKSDTSDEKVQPAVSTEQAEPAVEPSLSVKVGLLTGGETNQADGSTGQVETTGGNEQSSTSEESSSDASKSPDRAATVTPESEEGARQPEQV